MNLKYFQWLSLWCHQFGTNNHVFLNFLVHLTFCFLILPSGPMLTFIHLTLWCSSNWALQPHKAATALTFVVNDWSRTSSYFSFHVLSKSVNYPPTSLTDKVFPLQRCHYWMFCLHHIFLFFFSFLFFCFVTKEAGTPMQQTLIPKSLRLHIFPFSEVNPHINWTSWQCQLLASHREPVG